MGLILGSGSTKPQFPYDQWYGVQGDFASPKDYKLTRIGNMSLHKTLPLQNRMRRFVENTDGSVKYYLGYNDSRKTVGGATAKLDCTDGNVMLELPEYYFKLEMDGTKWAYAISEYPLPGFVHVPRRTVSPWYATYDQTNQKAVSGCFLTWDGDNVARGDDGLPIFTANAAQFRGGTNQSSWDGTYHSELGTARTNVNRTTFRSWCKDGTHGGSGRAYNTIKWFKRIEYASLHDQDTYNASLTSEGYHQGGLGSGCPFDWSQWGKFNGNRPFIPSGVTAPLGNNTGKVAYSITLANGTTKEFQVTSYRGFEVPYEYLWMITDDLLVYYGEKETTIYVCDDPTKFTTPSDSQTNVPDGYEPVATMPRTEGYGLTEAITDKGMSFINAVGGSQNTGVCDSFLRNATVGWWGALLSASANSGAIAGFGSLSTAYRAAYAWTYHAFRLCRN